MKEADDLLSATRYAIMMLRAAAYERMPDWMQPYEPVDDWDPFEPFEDWD